MRMKEESEKAGLNPILKKKKNKDHGIQCYHFTANRMAKGESKAVTDFLFLGCKITVDGDCSHEIRIQLLLGRKAMKNLDSVFKSKDITLLTNVHIVKAMIFPVVMYECESWTVKKAELPRIDAF